MKKILIISLVCLNVCLLAAVIFSSHTMPQAQGQIVGGGVDYLMIPGRVGGGLSSQAVYVIDLATNRMAATYVNRDKKLAPVYGRKLDGDFRRTSKK